MNYYSFYNICVFVVTLVLESTRNIQSALSTLSTAHESLQTSVIGWSNVEENIQLMKGATHEIVNGTCSLRPQEKMTAMASRFGTLCAAHVIGYTILHYF
jgi:hypothetical protein